MLSWPDGAKKAMSIFFVKWNDIDVYVEDTAKHAKNLYTALINRTLDGKAKVLEVFPLGDRFHVIDACKNDASTEGGRPRIYLIDGDLELAACIAQHPIHRLYRHEVYAVENYLVCEDAVSELLQEENPKYSLEDVKNLFDYPSFVESLRPLVEIFVSFGLTKRIDPSLPTISLGVGNFLDGAKYKWLDENKIAAFVKQRKIALLKVVAEKEYERHERAIRRGLAKVDSSLAIVAAREFLIPLIRFRADAKGLKIKAANESLYLRLAKRADMTKHKPLRDALHKIAR